MSVAYRNTTAVLVSLMTKDFRYLKISEQSAESFWIMLGAEQLDATSNTTAYIDDISLHEGWIVDRKCPEQEKQYADGYRYGFGGHEKINEVTGQGNTIDMGDRWLDVRLGRTPKMDAHSNKYSFISPYAYALNNPLNVIDPNGKDVVILIAKDGAGGMGHMGMIIQDKKGNWYYMTQGAADTEGGISKMTSGGVHGGVMLQALNTTDIEEAINLAKQDASNSPYTDQVILKTSSKMDKKIFEKAKEVQEKTNSGEKKYNLIFNNCVDACQEPIESGTGVKLPLDIDPRPNKYFEKLQKNVDNVQDKINKKIKKENNNSKQSDKKSSK